MTDNVAVIQGYTKEIIAECGAATLYLLIKPDTDLDSRFRAWDTDMQEFIMVNGWLATYEEPETVNPFLGIQVIPA